MRVVRWKVGGQSHTIQYNPPTPAERNNDVVADPPGVGVRKTVRPLDVWGFRQHRRTNRPT